MAIVVSGMFWVIFLKFSLRMMIVGICRILMGKMMVVISSFIFSVLILIIVLVIIFVCWCLGMWCSRNLFVLLSLVFSLVGNWSGLIFVMCMFLVLV